MDTSTNEKQMQISLSGLCVPFVGYAGQSGNTQRATRPRQSFQDLLFACFHLLNVALEQRWRRQAYTTVRLSLGRTDPTPVVGLTISHNYSCVAQAVKFHRNTLLVS